jgi:hypothetical protein
MYMNQGNGQSSARDFDFLLKPMSIRNRRRSNALYPDREGVWEEFEARNTGAQHLDGKVIIDHFEGGTFPDGQVRKGMTIRAFDEENQQWSLVWLDNRNPPDFRPLVGKFENGIGVFHQVIESPEGRTLHARFTWDRITANSARWQQAFSFDGGNNWDTNWVMEFSGEK